METIISDSDKTDEVHIEEYDKTDSVESSEYGFDDIEKEDPDDVDFDDEIIQDDDATTIGVKVPKNKKTFTDLVQEKIPSLANLIKRAKEKREAKVETSSVSKVEDKKGEKSGKEKPKLKLTPIHIVVIVGLVVLLFFGDEEIETSTTPSVDQRKASEIVQKNDLPVDMPEVTDSETQEDEASDDVTDTAQDPMEDIRMENTPTETPSVEERPELDVPSTADEDRPNNTLEDIDLGINSPEIAEDSDKPTESDEADIISDLDTSSEDIDSQVGDEVDISNDSETANMGSDSNQIEAPTVDKNDEISTLPEEILPQEIVEPELSSDMTRDLLKNLEVKLKEEKKEQAVVEALRPMSAPSYESPGRGLVYNCKGGHWACIDQDEYTKCRQNYSWNKSESIPIECYPLAFLENDYDCATVQQEKVDSVPDLGFCGK